MSISLSFSFESTTDHRGYRDATLSPDLLYRYQLSRRWRPGETVLWVMLNPSTADAQKDDATIRKVTAYSKAWGYGALTVVNLFAWRATDPRELLNAADPVGSDNDRTIYESARGTSFIVCAWGASRAGGLIGRRASAVQALLKNRTLHCLKKTLTGHPAHPLYLRGNLLPQVWRSP